MGKRKEIKEKWKSVKWESDTGNQAKGWFFGNINKTDKTLAKPTKETGEENTNDQN